MNFLLIHEDENLSPRIARELKKDFRATVDERKNFDEAVERLLEEKSIELVICEKTLANTPLFKYLATVEHSVPILLIDSKDDSENIQLPSLNRLATVPWDREDLLGNVKNEIYTALQDERLVAVAMKEYIPVKTELLVRIVPLKADIYIKLSASKFLKIFSTGDVFDSDDLERFVEEKKIHFFYLRKADSYAFLGNLKKMLAKVLSASEIKPEEALNVTSEVHEVAMKLGNELGFTPEVQELVKDNIALVVESAKGTNIELLLKRAAEMKYLAGHSTLLAHIACGIATRMDWNSQQTFEKIGYAAMLHDVALLKDDLAKIENLEELEMYKSDFTTKEIVSYKNHPQKGSEVARTFTEIPPDVDIMIAQHHERPDGSGFPRGLTSQRISVLSCLMIVVHDLVHAYYSKKQSIQEFVEEKSEIYQTGNFKKVMKAVSAQAKAEEEGESKPEKSAA